MAADRDGRGRAPERQVERDPAAAYDAMAHDAWIEGYRSANVARALARKRHMEKIRYRRAALKDARARRNRKRIVGNIR
jgi:hypothetical protein